MTTAVIYCGGFSALEQKLQWKERMVLDLIMCLLHEELLKAFGCMCLKHSDSNDKQFEVLFRVKVVSSVRCLHMKFSQQQKYWRCVIPCSVLPWGPGTQRSNRIYNNSGLAQGEECFNREHLRGSRRATGFSITLYSRLSSCSCEHP